MMMPLTRADAAILLVLAGLAAGGCSRTVSVAPPAVPPQLADARQLVVVTTPDWDSTSGTLRRFSRGGTSEGWRSDGDAIPVVVGRSGVGWGVGWEGFARTGEPRKQEGDGRSPAGIFPLDTAFGFAPREAMTSVRLPYVMLDPGTDCVDDGQSVHYNTVINRGSVAAVDWTSAEHMRGVAQYRLGVIVGYNAMPPRRGRGSCIFLHIWAGPGSTTAGCTALDAGALEELMQWLDPARRPVLVQLPAAAYARQRAAWRLP